MRFGLYLSLQHPVERDVREVMDERIELVHLIRDLGFDSVVCGQHFLVPPDVFMLQPVPVLGRIIAESGGLQVGTSILLATLVNPVELVENVLTLAAMTEQPFMVGVGAGYRPEEDVAFGVPAGKRIRHYTEKLAVIRKLLDGEPVTAEGPGYRLEDAVISMRVDPTPQLHVAATGEPGVRRAGRYGDAWVASTTVTLADIQRLAPVFAEAHGGPGVELPALRDVVVRSTDEGARTLAKPFLEPALAPAGSTPAFRPDVDAAGAYLIGSPDTVIRRLREHADAGVTHVIFRTQRPGLSLADAKETLGILAREVMPAFR
jgi:alkanesulfonate monooxygenase SsuD/methylene tetrahydromethanopterin reductase-like flavin-dependent oxidoreductase (luciferase family)